jgi:TRAP-type C4-dicarboxylate transport system substrate-binding protein
MSYKIILSALFAFMLFVPQFATAQDVREIDFVMAHKPDNADNVALTEEFAKRVSDRTGGAIKINIDSSGTNAIDDDNFAPVLRRVYDGTVGMTQIAVKKFWEYSSVIDVFEMPMIFRDHAHVAAVVDGKIGDELRESVLVGSNGRLHGLAFTYSGGFRNIYTSAKEVKSVADLRGMSMRIRTSRASRDAMHYLGVDLKTYLDQHWLEVNKEGVPLAEEAETIRIVSADKLEPDTTKNIKTVLLTNHNVFLTMVTINGPLYDSLTTEQQKIIDEEAKWLSHEERKLSIQQAIDGQKMFEERGIVFVEMTDADKAILNDMATKVHKKYANEPVAKYIEAIINTK